MPYKSEIERRNQFLWTQLLFLLTATLSLQTFVRNLNVLLLDILLLGHSTFDRFLLLDILLLTILFLIVACWIGGPSRGDMVGRRQELLHRPEQDRAQRTCPGKMFFLLSKVAVTSIVSTENFHLSWRAWQE
jgi:TRAP-type mannitol/chloroaromatic compound transport system permease small subunit